MDAKAKKEKFEKRYFYILDLKERTRPRQSLNEISIDAKAKKKKKNLKIFKKILDLKERKQTRHCQSLREISMDAKAKKKKSKWKKLISKLIFFQNRFYFHNRFFLLILGLFSHRRIVFP